MIGIIGAMEEEVSQLIEAMEEKEKVTCAGMDFYCGKLKDKEVVIVQSGIGKVNMALCTQILADRFDVKAVINTASRIRLRNPQRCNPKFCICRPCSP